VCYTKTNYNGIATSNAFYDGVISHGDIAFKITNESKEDILKIKPDVIVQVCDISPVDDHNCFRGFLRGLGIPRLVIDVGVLRNQRSDPNNLDRFLTVGFNGIKGDAQYYNYSSDSRRFQKLKWEPKPWHTDGDYYLILGQKSFGVGVYEFDINKYLGGIIKQLNARKEKVLFRYHPIERRRPSGKYDFSNNSLERDLEGARCAIGWTTNALVEAVYHGCPIITETRRCLAYEMASHSLDQPLVYPDRTQWLNNLSYSQWHINDMKNGECWKHYR
jgi:hypothetical protein